MKVIDTYNAIVFTFQYVSINTTTAWTAYKTANDFTFQYVSINTGMVVDKQDLIPVLYIPICFY